MRRWIAFCLCLLLAGPAWADDVLLYLPFDHDARPAKARGSAEPKVSGKVVLEDGLCGKAMVLGKAGGALTLDGKGNVDVSRGSAAFWVKPVDWDSKSAKAHNFFRIGSDHPKCLMYIYKYFKPDVLNVWMRIDPDDPRGKSYMMPGNFEREPPVVFKKGEWKHILLTWFDDQLRVYLDGKLRRHWPLAQALDSGTLGATVAVGANHDPASTLIDELYIFRHPLEQWEIDSLYRAGKRGEPLKPGAGAPFRPFEPKTDPDFRVYLKHFPEAGYIEAFADAGEFERVRDVARAVVTFGSVECEITKFVNGMGSALMEVKEVEPDEYVAIAEFHDRQGNVLGTGRSDALTVKQYPWMTDRSAGVTDQVIAPWTEIEGRDNTFKLWGRRIQFGRNGLPEQIESAGKSLLAAPIKLVGRIDGQPTEFSAASNLMVVDGAPNRVFLRMHADIPTLVVEVEAAMEYDGLIDFDVLLEPKRDSRIDELRLEIPVRADCATLFHYVGDAIRRTCYAGETPKGDGLVWSSKSVVPWRYGLQGNFVPFIWLGDEERGLSWFCDTTRGWSPGEKGRSEVYREGSTTKLVINFIGTPTRIAKKLRLGFGMMATPVKPLFEGWRRMYSKILEPYPIRNITHSCTFQGYGKPTDLKAFRKVIQSFRKYNPETCVMPAMGANDLWGGEESAYFINDWNARVVNGMATPMRNAFQAWWFRRVVRDMGIDGAYSDDSYPIPTLNPLGTTAWVDGRGVVHEGYNLAGIRGFHRRMATILRDCDGKGRSMVHMSDAMVIPCFSWYDFALDGEFGFDNAARTSRLPFDKKKEKEYDYLDVWRMDVIRARAMGKQWGLVPVWLPTGSPEESWGYGSEMPRVHRSLLAMTLLHDMLIWWNHKVDHDEVAKVDLVKKEFGIGEDDVTFHGYWQKKARASSKDVWVSYWLRPPNNLMLVAANLSSKDADVEIACDDLPDGPTAVDGISREEVPIVNGKLKLSVPWHEFRLILIGGRGEFAPGRPHPGADLPKPQQVLAELSDNFDSPTLSKAWTVDASPKSKAVIKTQDGKLKIRHSIFTWSHVERPLGVDNISVQCRVEDRVSGNFDTWRPCIALYWGKGSYARAMASCQYNATCFKFLVMADSKTVAEQKEGPPISTEGWYTHNWVKIALTPDEIKFYGSSDGKTWLEPWVVKRPKALTGPPRLLILGSGHETGTAPYTGPDFDNDWTRGTWGQPTCMYFDDLIVGKD